MLGDAPSPVQVALGQDEGAPGQARGVTRQALADWRLPGLVDAVVLAVSELVTNAVRHGWPPLSMELRRRPEQVRLAVHDGNPAEPSGPGGQAGPDAECGRGLSIVNALADEVVVEQVTDGGKVIYATFGIPPPDLL